MTNADLRPVLRADVLMDAAMPRLLGSDVIAVPAVRVEHLLLFPWPELRRDESGRVVQVVLDVTRWLISHPSRVYLPLVLADVETATACAEQFIADRASQRLPSDHPDELTRWAAWWCQSHPENAVPLAASEGGTR